MTTNTYECPYCEYWTKNKNKLSEHREEWHKKALRQPEVKE